MAKGRKTQLSRNPQTGRWRLYARPATETTYLGGLTAPGLTRRPHMGPFNRVTDYKISDADEVYRRHDIGYGKELAAGRSPYTRWNKYDEDLMNSPSTGWADYVAKAAFGAKRFFTYGLPYTKNTSIKPVYSKPPKWEPKSIDDFYMNPISDAPFVFEGGGIDPDVVELQRQQQAQAWANKGSRTEVNPDLPDYTPGGPAMGGGGHSKISFSRTYIER